MRLISEYKYTEVGNVCGVDVFLVPNIGKEGLIGEHFSPAWLVQELDEKLEKLQKTGVPQESTMVINQREVARSLARSILRLFSYHVGNRLIGCMGKVVQTKKGLVKLSRRNFLQREGGGDREVPEAVPREEGRSERENQHVLPYREA